MNSITRNILMFSVVLLAGAGGLLTAARAEDPARAEASAAAGAEAGTPAAAARTGAVVPSGVVALTDAESDSKVLVERLHALRPGIRVKHVTPTPVPGLFALDVSGGTTLYGTADGRYLFAGDLYDMTGSDLVDIAEGGRAEQRRALMATADPASMLIFKTQGDPKAVINVFTDVDCPYCQKLHLEVPRLNAMGIEVRYLGFPRAGIGSETYDRIVSAWCASDPNDALTRIKRGEQIPAATCDNRIAEHYGLGREMGISGTPAIVLEDGTLLPGYLPAAEIAKAVGI